MSITFSPELYVEDTSEFCASLVDASMGSANVTFVLALADIEFDYSGTVDADFLLNRLLLACGRNRENTQDLLLRVIPVARQAKELGRRVQWA